MIDIFLGVLGIFLGVLYIFLATSLLLITIFFMAFVIFISPFALIILGGLYIWESIFGKEFFAEGAHEKWLKEQKEKNE